MDITREALTKAIGLVVPGIARKEVFDQANKLAFDQGNLISYNDQVSIFHPLEGSEELSGALDGRRLYDLLNKTDSSNVKMIQKGNNIEVSVGRTTVSLITAPVALPFAEIDWTGEDQILPNDFKKGLKLVASTCARDMSRPVLTCVYMAGEYLTGSDGYRVAQFRIEGADLPSILLPVTAAELLEDEDYVIKTVAVGEKGEWVRFATEDNTVICARTSSGTYPDLSATLSTEGEDITLPKRLTETLERAQIFSKRDHRIDEEVRITLSGTQIVVGASCDGGTFKEIVRASQEVSGEFMFNIHPDFLSRALTEENANCVLNTSKIKFTGPQWEHVVALR
jgi:DNA polymerase III sliding clamp (beta) subunit (PCNA family)